LSIIHDPSPPEAKVKFADPLKPAGLYDLGQIRKFAGDNPETLKNIIISFTDQTKENISLLESLAKNNEWQAAGELAHKMLTSMGHFGVDEALESLKLLDKNRTGEIDTKISQSEVKHLCEIVESLIPRLYEEVREADGRI